MSESVTTICSDCSDQQRAFQEAAAAAIGGEGSCTSGSTPSRSESTNIEAWARSKGTLISESEIDCLPVVSNSTSEHEVFYKEAEFRAIKRTWAGVYGQIPVPENGKLGRKNAIPSEYLNRMALQIAVFGSDIKLEGVCISSKDSMIIGQPSGQPSIVISQQWYEKVGVATNEAIHDLLIGEGFRSVPGSYFGYYRPADKVVIVDAKPDNFINTEAGLVAIDLQMAIFTDEELTASGLNVNTTAGLIYIPR